jgi:membrane protein DedA with SNARE-associated domain
VFAAGVFEVPLASFTAAISLARLLRYFGVGYLATRYGANALPYLAAHKLEVAVTLAALVAASYGLSRLLFKVKEELPSI